MKKHRFSSTTSMLVALAVGFALVAPLVLTETAGAYTSMNEYATNGSSVPYGICAGSDGNIWFAEFGTRKIGRIKTDGTGHTEYATTGTSRPFCICAGPDGNVWFTDYGTSKVGSFQYDHAAPTASSITASSGAKGTSVNVSNLAGTGFYGTPGVRLVKSGGSGLKIDATDVSVASPTKITCSLDLAKALTGSYDVVVTNGDGQSAKITGGFSVTAAVSSTFYFAEGTCRPGFDPYLCVQNPGGAEAAVTVTYMKGDGGTATQDITVPAHSRSTVSCKDTLGEGEDAAHDFSSEVACTNGQSIIAERPMYFNYKGVWTGGSDVTGFTP